MFHVCNEIISRAYLLTVRRNRSDENNTIAHESHRHGEWVVRKSARGFTYRVWRRVRVPTIPQHYLDCSIYLYESKASAEEGENFGGSGCLVSVESNPVWEPSESNDPRRRKASLFFPPHIYAVTNKHIVEGDFPCPVVRLNTIDGSWDVLELEVDDWIPHPGGDDLVVAPIELPEGKHRYFPIHTETHLHRHNLGGVGAGDDTFMIGRFVSHEGAQRNTPSLRFGNIAMLPFEEIRLVDGHMQEAFLVETRSLSGYSGSPVFVYQAIEEKMRVPLGRNSIQYVETQTRSITSLVGYCKLLGIDCGHVLHYEDVLDASLKATGWKVQSNTGMAIVIPAWRLYDLLHTEALTMQRKQKDKEYEEKAKAEKQESRVASDIKKPEGFSADDYQEALKRASRKIESEKEGE